MSNKACKYRVTGEQSIDRLVPLLSLIHPTLTWEEAKSSTDNLDFVWETSCEKHWRDAHLSATILNKMHNSQV